MRISFFKVRPKNHPFPLFAWLVMIFQGMNPFKKDSWSHMALSVGDTVYDVHGEGFREHTVPEFFEIYRMVDIKSKHYDIDIDAFYEWLDTNRSVEYDSLQIFGLALKALKLKKMNTMGGDLSDLICSELILGFLIKFDGLVVKDTDNWDLHMTWEAI